MTTFAEHIIIAGAENRPPMLEKSVYDHVYLIVEENGQTRPKKYSELTEAQQLQDDCDGETLNDTTGHSFRLYNLFDKFAHVPDLSQHERHANEVRINRERYSNSFAFVANSLTLYNPSQSPQHSSYSMYPPPQQFTPVYAAPILHQHHHTSVNPVNPQQHPVFPSPFISPSMTLQSQAEFPQLDSGLAVPMFPPSNNQLRTSSNPRNQATIQDAFQTDDLDAYDSDCDDLSSAKAVLMANLSSCDPEVLSEVPYSDSYPNDMINQDVQEMQYSEQTHVDDFEDNEIHSGSNIISYSQYLQETQDAVIQDTNPSTPNDLLVLSLVEQMTDHVAHLDKENQTNKMVNESLTAELERYKERIAIFEQRLNVDLNKREKLIDSQMDDLIRDRNAKLAAFQQEIDTLKETLSNNVKEKESLSKTLTVFKTESKEKESKYIDKEIVLEKQNKELENIICKMYRSTQAMHMLTKPQVFYDDTHKQALGYQNPFHLKKAQRIQPTLYDGSVIAKEHAVISVIDDEETLILEEESRSKMLDKQNDPISIEKKIKISPIDYSKLNKIKEDFRKRFVTKKNCLQNKFCG
ncbi:hypothetical protein Tco_0332394 [Tanacetum coccineum]